MKVKIKKILFALALYVCALPVLFSQTKTENKIKIKVVYTQTYCGGAKPNPEIMAGLNTEKPLANCSLMLVSSINMAGKGPVVKTDEKGEVLVALKNGKYNVYLASNKKNKATLPFNKTCKKIMEMQLGTFDFAEKECTVQIRIPCDPCDESMKKRP